MRETLEEMTNLTELVYLLGGENIVHTSAPRVWPKGYKGGILPPVCHVAAMSVSEKA